MVGVLQIAMICLGLYLLIAGKIKSRNYVLKGGPARGVGAVLLLPVPLAFMICVYVGIVVGTYARQQGWQVNVQDFKGLAWWIEAVVAVLCLVAAGVLAWFYRRPIKRRRKAVEPAEE